MRDLLIILDSVRYDRFMEADAPELKKLGKVHRAYSHGTWTRPSVVSMLSGYLPQSELGQLYKPSWVMCGSYMFHDREIPAWFLNANAWTHRMAPSSYVEKWYPKPHSAEQMIMDAKEIMESHQEFFVAMLLVETHGPYDYKPSKRDPKVQKLFRDYNNGEDNEAPLVAAERQREAISYLSRLLEPILDIPNRVIVTSDHGDIMGDDKIHRIGHDPTFGFHIKLLEVPLIVSDRDEVKGTS